MTNRLLAAFVVLAASAQAQQYDVLIRNGRMLDGTGNPWYYADIGVTGNRIAAVGSLDNATAARVIDATGLYVSPGFIDVHSHAATGLTNPALAAGQPQANTRRRVAGDCTPCRSRRASSATGAERCCCSAAHRAGVSVSHYAPFDACLARSRRVNPGPSVTDRTHSHHRTRSRGEADV